MKTKTKLKPMFVWNTHSPYSPFPPRIPSHILLLTSFPFLFKFNNLLSTISVHLKYISVRLANTAVSRHAPVTWRKWLSAPLQPKAANHSSVRCGTSRAEGDWLCQSANYVMAVKAAVISWANMLFCPEETIYLLVFHYLMWTSYCSLSPETPWSFTQKFLLWWEIRATSDICVKI